MFKGTDSVTINVGGTPTTFKAGASVTPGEYLLIQQTLTHSSTDLVLNGSGVATGGSFSLNGRTEANASEIVVASGVTALDSSKSLSLSGNLVNYGTVDAVSLNSSAKTDTISAQNITNEKSGEITTQLSNNLLSLAPNAVSNVNLTLNAANSLANSGVISSAGNVTLNTSTGSITNNAGGVVKAETDVNLNSGSGNINNAGLLNSHTGNINLNCPDNVDLNVNATGGTFKADAGDINLRAANYQGTNNINLTGGNYLSNNLNLNAGSGNITGSVNNVSGTLNESGNAAHFTADTANLSIGNNAIVNDPTWANIGGSIDITGVVTSSNQAVTILAAGNIVSTATGQITDHGR